MMTKPIPARSTQILDPSLDAYLASLAGTNNSPQTIRAYQTDLNQFIPYLR